MPEKSTKHIARPQEPIGAVKDGKVKVLDGDTQRIGWRSGTKGMSRDYDGEPTAAQPNLRDLKSQPKHSAHMANKTKGHKAHKGQRDGAYNR